jgi:predicted DNA-binding transcriptional regulator YafY
MKANNAAPQANPFAQLSQVQLERLAYIEFRLYFLGEVRRHDLMSRFGIAPAAATRDFAQYRECCPENISFDGSTKTYTIASHFSPVFDHTPERVLIVLSQGFGDGVVSAGGALLRCELPTTLNRPSVEVLAPVTRAINLQKAVSLSYYSHTSGMSERVISPFAIVNDGLRWHVRAFDRKSGEFRDFVFTRMYSTEIIEDKPVEKHELPYEDDQWNRIIVLDLVPHPAREHSEIIERDYGMTNGVLKIKVRAAIAGYFLRQWIVDCSYDHSIPGEEYRLWLRDNLVLYGVESALMAPGYRSSQHLRASTNV